MESVIHMTSLNNAIGVPMGNVYFLFIPLLGLFNQRDANVTLFVDSNISLSDEKYLSEQHK